MLKHKIKNKIQTVCSLAVLAIVPALLFSCEAVEGTIPEYPVKNKTLLVYMAANNNLSGNAENNFADMQKGYIPEAEGNLVVYSHLYGKNPVLIHLLRQEDGRVAADTVYRFPARNSATAASLTSALKLTATLFPAGEYGLILWSHGTGWLPSGYYSSGTMTTSGGGIATPVQRNEPAGADVFVTGGQSFAFDGGYPDGKDPYAGLVKMAFSNGDLSKSFGSEDGKEIEIVDLAKALPYKLSFVIFDACLMGGIEVAYQLKDSTDYVLFSPAEVLTSGFPYSKIMEPVFRSPSDLAAVAEEYYNYYNALSGSARAGTISLVKTSELEPVAAAAKEVFDTRREAIQSLYMNGIQRYYRDNKHWFYDLNDFISQLGTAEQAAAFTAALNKAVIYKAATPYFLDIPVTKYSGVSTYIPNPQNADLDAFYKKFTWNTASGMIE